MKLTWIAAPAILFSLAPVANAHIDMLTPTPRYTEAVALDNKACPCGVGESSRLCNVEGDRSDPDRAAAPRITTLNAGGTVTIQWDEYIAHQGRFRVAIDYDGADLEDFNSNILLDITDPAGKIGNSGVGSIWEVEVQLPNVNCDNCTLQLIQVMDGDPAVPVVETIGRSTYYTCADITLVGADPTAPDAGPGPADPDAGIAPGEADAGDNVGPGDGSSGPTSGGCQTSGSSTGGAWMLLLLGAFAWRRRRSA